jgi:hypothetical protein
MHGVLISYSDFSKASSNAHCTALFRVKAAKNGKIYSTAITFDMGDDSDISAIQEIAYGLKKEEVIKELNKE